MGRGLLPHPALIQLVVLALSEWEQVRNREPAYLTDLEVSQRLFSFLVTVAETWASVGWAGQKWPKEAVVVAAGTIEAVETVETAALADAVDLGIQSTSEVA